MLSPLQAVDNRNCTDKLLGLYGWHCKAYLPAICVPEDLLSGHKRVHAVKYQAIMCANDIECELHGPYPGHRHDTGEFISFAANCE